MPLICIKQRKIKRAQLNLKKITFKKVKLINISMRSIHPYINIKFKIQLSFRFSNLLWKSLSKIRVVWPLNFPCMSIKTSRKREFLLLLTSNIKPQIVVESNLLVKLRNNWNRSKLLIKLHKSSKAIWPRKKDDKVHGHRLVYWGTK